MVSVQEIKKQDTTTILADIVGLSTDEKPTTLGGKSVANGSTFVEMNTSDIYLYDQQNEEWKKFSGGSGGGGDTPQPAEDPNVYFELSYDDEYDKWGIDCSPKDIAEAISENKSLHFTYKYEEFGEDTDFYYANFTLCTFSNDSSSHKYYLDICSEEPDYPSSVKGFIITFSSTGYDVDFNDSYYLKG